MKQKYIILRWPNAPEVATQGISVEFKTIGYQNPNADSDRRIIVKGLDVARVGGFMRALFALVSGLVSSMQTEEGVVVDLAPQSAMTKYEFMDQVLGALQKIGVNISD